MALSKRICKKCKYFREKMIDPRFTNHGKPWLRKLYHKKNRKTEFPSRTEWYCMVDGHRDTVGANWIKQDGCPYLLEHLVETHRK